MWECTRLETGTCVVELVATCAVCALCRLPATGPARLPAMRAFGRVVRVAPASVAFPRVPGGGIELFETRWLFTERVLDGCACGDTLLRAGMCVPVGAARLPPTASTA